MNFALLVIRVVVGLLFVGHGAQKLFGWFGGHGIQGTGGFFESLGLRPGRRHAIAAGLAEAGGGLLLVLGLLTPLAAAAISATMLVAIWLAHRQNGVWSTNNGYELNLSYLAAVLVIAAFDSGAWSLDHALSLGATGAGWALAQLGAGVLGAAGAVIAGRTYRSRRPRARVGETHPTAA